MSPEATPEDVATLTFAQLRDELLAKGGGPLDRGWVARVNAAEAEFWRRNSGCAFGMDSFGCRAHLLSMPAAKADIWRSNSGRVLSVTLFALLVTRHTCCRCLQPETDVAGSTVQVPILQTVGHELAGFIGKVLLQLVSA